MEKSKILTLKKALFAAFPNTIPILAGFLFLGMTYGIYMRVSGFNALYPFFMALLVFGGSLEFVIVTMLLSPFAPVQAFIMSLLIQARHIFYGLSMLEKYKGMGIKKFYLIFAMCDESFSINYTADIPDDVDSGWFMFFVNLLNQIYWVMGAVTGSILGSFIRFNTEGLEFVMVAMFVVIFVEQLKKEKRPYTALIGIIASAVCLILFGADSFMIPSMIAILALLTLFKKPIGDVYGGNFSHGNPGADGGMLP